MPHEAHLVQEHYLRKMVLSRRTFSKGRLKSKTINGLDQPRT